MKGSILTFLLVILLFNSCDIFMVEDEEIHPQVTDNSKDTMTLVAVLDSNDELIACDTFMMNWHGCAECDTHIVYDTIYCNLNWDDLTGRTFAYDEVYNHLLNSHTEYTFTKDSVIAYTLRYYKEDLRVYERIVNKGLAEFRYYCNEDDSGLTDGRYGIKFRWTRTRYWGENFEAKVGGTTMMDWFMVSMCNDTDDIRIHKEEGVGSNLYWIFWDFYEVSHSEYQDMINGNY